MSIIQYIFRINIKNCKFSVSYNIVYLDAYFTVLSSSNVRERLDNNIILKLILNRNNTKL